MFESYTGYFLSFYIIKRPQDYQKIAHLGYDREEFWSNFELFYLQNYRRGSKSADTNILGLKQTVMLQFQIFKRCGFWSVKTKVDNFCGLLRIYKL